MILERGAAYLLAVVCLFQALHPSRMIRPQSWRSIDVRIGGLRVQATNGTDSICFERPTGEREESICSAERRISLLHSRPSHPKRLRICMNDRGCITVWLDGWSISKSDNSE